MSSRTGVCGGEGVPGRRNSTDKKAWKEDPSVPKDGTDIKFRNGGKAGQDRFTDLGSEQALS